MHRHGSVSSWSERKMRRSLTSKSLPGRAARTLWVRVAMIAVVVAPLAAQRSPAVGIRGLANVRELHDIMISPASDAVFAASSNQALDAKGWTDARNEAILLAESGNLLMVGTRVRDNGNWMKMSRAMVD